jgi:hypothetical protein
MNNADPPLPSRITVPVRTEAAATGSPAQQAFQQAILEVESLREQLQHLRTGQADGRRLYWQQVGPVAAAVVAARRALYSPLEDALLAGYFSRAEEQQLSEFIVGNARTLEDRFGEDETEILRKYGRLNTSSSASEPAEDDESTNDPNLPPHEQAAAQARARRLTKAQKTQDAAARLEQENQQRLLSNTKTVYRQLARANHPDLERDPAAQQSKTALMQRITEAYEADDLYTLLQLLSESGPADAESEEVLARYTSSLQQQQTEFKRQVQELRYGPHGFFGSSGKKQEKELRQIKRDLRAELDYLEQVARLLREPNGVREVLRTLAAGGHDTI